MVHTIDFFTPIVNDPFDFGYIAANNAVNDIYAMGGEPLEALNVVCFPCGTVPNDALSDILKGGADFLYEHQVPLLGGHSVKDKEIKYGLSVTGLVRKENIMLNKNAMPGDNIYITKPIGSGIISTLHKFDNLPEEDYLDWVRWLKLGNKEISKILVEHHIKACTDVSGFGIAGHLSEVLNASQVSAEVYLQEIPFLTRALEGFEKEYIPGGLMNNREFYKDRLVYNELDTKTSMLFDPQSAGGFMFFVPDSQKEAIEKSFNEKNIFYKLIGRVLEKNGKS